MTTTEGGYPSFFNNAMFQEFFAVKHTRGNSAKMCTRNKRMCFTFTWTIENISYCWQKGLEYFRSPTFVINALQESKYYLQIRPRRYEDDDDGCITFHLHSINNSSLKIDCELAFLSKDGSILKSIEQKNCTNCAGSLEFIKINEIFVVNRSVYLPEDKLTARCRIWKSDGEMTEDVQLFARTRICIKKEAFLWDIQNFSSLHSEEKCTYQIKSMTDNEVLMTLDLFLKNPYTDEDSITIQLVSENCKIKYFVLHLMHLNGFGSAYKDIRKEFAFCENKKSKLFTLPFSKKNLMSKKNICLPNDVLSFQCECTFSTGDIIEEIESVIYGKIKCKFSTSEIDNLCLDDKSLLSMSKRILNENLKSLFEDNFLSDIKLKTSSETFLVHKNILSARSPVFKAMFLNNMKEKYNKCVDIEDFDSDTVQRMLQYIYTAEVKDLQWEGAFGLYRAADQYEILSLRDECSAYLKSNLHPNNGCEVLILADLHQDENLKASVQEFIFNHDIINSEEWKQLMKTHVKLAADTMYLQIQRKSLSRFFTTAPTGTTITFFNPPTGTDTMCQGGVCTSIETRHQCITCMKEYENKSLEELRVEDYAAKRKGGSTISVTGFGAPTQQTSIFGVPATSSSYFSFGGNQSENFFGTTGTKKFLDEFGMKSDRTPSAVDRFYSTISKTRTASSRLNRSNKSIPSAAKVFNFSSTETSSPSSFSFGKSGQKTPVNPSFLFGSSSEKEPVKSSFSFGNSSEKESVNPSFSFGNSSEKEPVKPSFSFGNSSEKEPVKPTFSFGKSSEKEPAKLSFTFDSSDKKGYFKPSFTFFSSDKKESVKPFFSFGNSSEKEPVKPSFSIGNSSEKEPVKPSFSIGNSIEKEPVKPSFSIGNSIEKEPVKPPFSFGNRSEKEPVKPSFVLGNCSEKESVKPSFMFFSSDEKESAKQYFTSSYDKEPVKLSFPFGSITEKEPIKESLSLVNSDEKEPVKPVFSFISSGEKEPVKPSFSFSSNSEKEPVKSFSFGNSSEKEPVKPTFSFASSGEKEHVKEPFSFASSDEKEHVKPSFSVCSSSEKEPHKQYFPFSNNDEKEPVNQSFSFGGSCAEAPSPSPEFNSGTVQAHLEFPGLESSSAVTTCAANGSGSAAMHSTHSEFNDSNAKTSSASLGFKSMNGDTLAASEIVSSIVETSPSIESNGITSIIAVKPSEPFFYFDSIGVKVSSSSSGFNSNNEAIRFASPAFDTSSVETPVSSGFDNSSPNTLSDFDISNEGKLSTSTRTGSSSPNTPTTSPNTSTTSVIDSSGAKIPSASTGCGGSYPNTPATPGIDSASAKMPSASSELDYARSETPSASAGLDIICAETPESHGFDNTCATTPSASSGFDSNNGSTLSVSHAFDSSFAETTICYGFSSASSETQSPSFALDRDNGGSSISSECKHSLGGLN